MVVIRELQKPDIIKIVQAFKEIGWNKSAAQYQRYLSEQGSPGLESLVRQLSSSRETARALARHVLLDLLDRWRKARSREASSHLLSLARVLAADGSKTFDAADVRL